MPLSPRLAAYVLLVATTLAGCLPEDVTAGQCLGDGDCLATQHCVAPVCTDCIDTPHGTCAEGARCHADTDCRATEHCGPGAVCQLGARCPGAGAVCASSSQATTYCEPGPSGDAPFCQPMATTATCLALAPALMNTGGACVPGDACDATTPCRDGEMCLDGQCRGSPLCATDADCGAGRGCDRGQCFFRCDAGQPCPDQTACTVGSCEWLPSLDGPCAAGQLYFASRCRAECNHDADCALRFTCDDGLCRLDDRTARARPAPVCVLDSDCAVGSRCLAGGCRAACPGGTAAECQRADVTLTHCDAQGICRP